MKELGITKGEWVADLRSGCCAIYLKSRKDETNGLHHYDDRNLFYSNKVALRDEKGWIMDAETQANFLLAADAGNTAQKCGLLPSELLQQRDELKEALAEQKRLYFSLFDEEINCMYCEAKIRRGSAIILCKECAENTEV